MLEVVSYDDPESLLLAREEALERAPVEEADAPQIDVEKLSPFDADIVAMHELGKTQTEIGLVLGRCQAAISYRLAKLGLRRTGVRAKVREGDGRRLGRGAKKRDAHDGVLALDSQHHAAKRPVWACPHKNGVTLAYGGAQQVCQSGPESFYFCIAYGPQAGFNKTVSRRGLSRRARKGVAVEQPKQLAFAFSSGDPHLTH